MAERNSALRIAASETPLAAPIAERGPSPLSFAQERLWLLHQLDPKSVTYNSRLALRLAGEIDVRALKASLDAIVARHSILRTRFVLQGDVPVQEILPSRGFELRTVDLQGITAGAREPVSQRLMHSETIRPFSLSTGRVIRGMLIRCSDSDHLLSIDAHHIVADGSSLGVFARELAILYEAFCSGRPSPLTPLPMQYADFARWERQRLSGAKLERELGYWVSQLRDCPPLELPTEVPGRNRTDDNGCELFTIEGQTSAALLEIARRCGVSSFMLLLSIFGVFLSRYSGLRDIVLGTIVQNRPQNSAAGLIGFFANLLAVRLRVRPEQTFTEHLRAVRDVCLKAYSHQQAPFERIVERLKAARNGSDQPLTDVVFTTALALPPLRLGGVEVKWLADESGFGRFGLFLSMWRTAQGFAGQIQYKTEKYSADTVRQMAGYWRTLLRSVADAPESLVRNLQILTPEERRKAAIAAHAHSSTRVEISVAELFREAAGRAADRVAIECALDTITYGELDRRSNLIAARLAGLGIQTDVPVAICVERSIGLVLAILSVLKAGGAYVPLDPDFPDKRLRTILSNAGTPLTLTSTTLKSRFEEWGEVTSFTVDELAREDSGHQEVRTESIPIDAAAYILYTSGSTGVPKGVAVTQGSLANSLTAVGALLQMNAEDAVAALSTVTFDIAAVELLLPLTLGARVVMAKGVAGRHPEESVALFSSGRLTVAQATPSTWRLLLAAGCKTRPGMRLIAGGEALPLDLARELTAPHVTLWNGYGPTEATIYSTFYRFPDDSSNPAIGRPIANTSAFILDENLQIVPNGASGELYLGGAGVGRGYWGTARLTAERFVPDPFGDSPGGRLYRTGDLARRRAGGDIDYLGRADAQVKLRGNRIEPGEIAATIRSYPGIRDCVVVLRRDGGDDYLAAYYVPDPGTSVARADLRRHIQANLPTYMVPAALVALPRLPLMPAGKIDTQALPTPDKDPEPCGVAPQTPTERELAAIWQDLLGLKSVSADANFFDLGGHSLLAMQVILRARNAFGVDIPFRTLFEAQTIHSLADRIERLGTATGRRVVPALCPVPRPAEIPLSFAQERLWMLDQMNPGSAAYTIAGGVVLDGELNVSALLESIAEVARRHEVLRTVYPLSMGRPIQVVQAPSTVSIAFITSFGDGPMAERTAKAAAYLESEAQTPFDLTEGPVFRARVVCVSGDRHYLMIAMHHIAADGWSIALIVQELSVLYAARTKSLPSPLPEPRLQYADFAVWQRRWAEGEVLESHRRYWALKLEAARALVYPADRPHMAHLASGARAVSFRLPPALANSLEEFARRERVTRFVLLLAAWKGLVFQHTGVADIVLGAPVANRGHQELEEVVGCFINTLPLRTDLSGAQTFRDVLRRVADTCTGAYEHQELPYEQMTAALQREPEAGDLIRMLFVFRNEPQPSPRFEELAVRSLPVCRNAAKFDITVDIQLNGPTLAGSIEYDAGIYDHSTICRLAGHYERLLERVVECPDSRLEELEPEMSDSAGADPSVAFPELQKPLLL